MADRNLPPEHDFKFHKSAYGGFLTLLKLSIALVIVVILILLFVYWY